MRSKDDSIEALLERLELPRRGWIIVDHWEGDRCAVGVAARRSPHVLVYVSSFGMDRGRFYYTCESPSADADVPYEVASEGADVSFDELLAAMELHLRESP